ncbi:MAG: hypothetical protein K2H70_00790, partial [Bacteroidales bacterium]|nr:hypothetical protein [Bacteroidales bacterium]
LYHADGSLSSEGYVVDGEPEGWWRSYDHEGRLISQGHRKDHLLDGLWTFYENGFKKSEITYYKDIKHGKSTYYFPTGIQEEYYRQGKLDGLRSYYDTLYRLIKTEPFSRGEKHGLAKNYNTLGEIIYVRTYRSGVLVGQQALNRRDKDGLRQGVWKGFHANDQVAWEVPYVDDLKDGYYKEYDTLGNIVRIEKYVRGVLEEDAPELAKVDIYTEYYADGRPKMKVGYKNGKPEGICREYDSLTGKVVRGTLFRNGEIVGGGIIDDNGYFQDDWKEYYSDGTLKCEGRFRRGRKQGVWTYYYPDGKKEQEGCFAGGRYDGIWTWYYPDGSLRLQQTYYRGLPDGLTEEYDEQGVCIVRGHYVEGLEDGMWTYVQGEERTEGRYKDGERSGLWKSYWHEKGNALSFRGHFIDGQPHGTHYYYWENGKLREEARYSLGRRVGRWTKYDEKGDIIVRVQYNREEEEVKYNGKRTLTRSEEAEDPDEYYRNRQETEKEKTE